MKNRSKILIITLTFIMIFSAFPVYSKSITQTFNKDSISQYPIKYNETDNRIVQLEELKGLKSTNGDIYIGNFYDEHSREGYVPVTKDGEKCLMRVRHIKRSHTEPYLYNSKFLLSLYRGQSRSVTETITDSKTTTIERSITTSVTAGFQMFGQKAQAKIETSIKDARTWFHEYKISTTDVFTFPEDVPSQYSYVNLYSGFTHDIYEAVADYVPYETYDKKTKVTNINVSSPPPNPNEEIYRYDVYVHLEDGRVLDYHGIIPPHHYHGNENLEDTPEVQRVLRKFADGYYHEYTSGYNYNNREEFIYDVEVPIPSIKYEPTN